MKTIKTDVLVCGGGCAGVAAALASARNNVRTLVIERAGFLGGIITATGLPYFDGLMAKQQGRRIIVRGIPLELAVLMGSAKPNARTGDDCRSDLLGKTSNALRIPNVEEFKLLADRLITQHGEMLTPLYHTMACDVERRGDRIAAVLVANKDGLVRVEAKQVVDCTGDADIAAWAGCPVEQLQPTMPMSLHFRIGNVRKNDAMKSAAREALVAAHERGDLPAFYGPGLNFAFADDEAYIHAVRVPGNAVDAADLTRAEMQGRRDAWTMFRAWKENVPGFEEAYFICSGPYIGIRETRRIQGAYVLTADDLRARRSFDDAIATGCWYLDVHPNSVTVGSANRGGEFQPEPYDIPYRSLVPRSVSNLLVAGRCHSATAEAASSTRVTCTAMAMGQAAGTAAALAVHAGSDMAALDGTKVRSTLAAQGAGPFSYA
ncbi:MAG TPA: FAD-dependent oxidoreductase [Pirellulales bacterium]|nr:FAD-dependent oxidoreductase [Pirellulales bacterium]